MPDEKIHFAGIDIGSNAVRLLIKSVPASDEKSEPEKVQLIRVPVRLGEDVFTTGRISDRKCRQMVLLMQSFSNLLQVYDVVAYRACATSAMREAGNALSLIEAVRQASGIEIEVVTGTDEASLVSDIRIRSLTTDDRYALFVDVGGGSTELTLFDDNHPIDRISFDIGTVRLLKEKVAESEWNRLVGKVKEIGSRYAPCRVIGTGGNINKIARMLKDGRRDNGDRFVSTAGMEKLYRKMNPLDIEKRMDKYGLKRDRADVIIPAMRIFLTILDKLKSKGVDVPTAGLADGIINELYAAHLCRS